MPSSHQKTTNATCSGVIRNSGLIFFLLIFLAPYCAAIDTWVQDRLEKAFLESPVSRKLILRLKTDPLFVADGQTDFSAAQAALAARVEALIQNAGGVRCAVQALPCLKLAVIDLPEQGAALAANLSASPEVEWAEPALQRPFHDTPEGEPFFDFQWSLENTADPAVEHELELKGIAPLDFAEGSDIGAREAWEAVQGQVEVVAAILDSGVDYTHIDLGPRMWRNPDEIPGNGVDDDDNGYTDDVHGWHAFENHGNPMDDIGHGTHVAGIAAAAVNGVGIAGVAPNARIMAVNVADPVTRWEDDAAIIAGIEYIIRQALRGVNVRVVNISLGGPGKSRTLQYAMERLAEAGVLAVVSMGNESASNDLFVGRYPVNCPISGIIGVGSSDPADQISVFSNVGDYSCDLFSPGSAILSTVPEFLGDYFSWTDGGYFWSLFSGTSMAAPIVTGAAAVAWGLHPDAEFRQIKDLILQSAKPCPALSGFSRQGSRLDLAALAVMPLPESPALYRLNAILPRPGQIVSILGNRLGREPGRAAVDGKTLKISEWSENAVTVRLPRHGADRGPKRELLLTRADGRAVSMPFYMAKTGGFRMLNTGETGGYEVMAPHENKAALIGKALYGILQCGPAPHLAWGSLDLRRNRLDYLCELPANTSPEAPESRAIEWKWTTLTAFRDWVYCIGGMPDGTVCRYHIKTGVWDFSILQPMRGLLRGAAVTADAYGVYLAGGIVQDPVTSAVTTNETVFWLNPETGVWRVLGEWKTARMQAAALVANHRLFLAGGTAFSFVAQAPYQTCDILDLKTGAWATTALPVGVSSGALARAGRRVCFFMPRDAMGATTPFVFTAPVHLKDGDKWRIHPVRFDFTDVDRKSAWAGSRQGRLYVAGGDWTGCPELPCPKQLKIFALEP